MWLRFTRYTDYSLRVLIHLALHDGRLCSIGEISRTYDVSHNHLMKVVNALTRDGFIETVHSRSGGMRLDRPADRSNVGDDVRRTEEDFALAECSGFSLSPDCGLPGVLAARTHAIVLRVD